MLEEIGLLTDTHFQIPRLPALVTLPMSLDYPLRISAHNTKSLEQSVRILLTQTLIESKPRSREGEEVTGERKRSTVDMLKRLTKEKD